MNLSWKSCYLATSLPPCSWNPLLEFCIVREQMGLFHNPRANTPSAAGMEAALITLTLDHL